MMQNHFNRHEIEIFFLLLDLCESWTKKIKRGEGNERKGKTSESLKTWNWGIIRYIYQDIKYTLKLKIK